MGKGQQSPSSQGAGKSPLMTIKLSFNSIFVLHHLPHIKTTFSDQLREKENVFVAVILA